MNLREMVLFAEAVQVTSMIKAYANKAQFYEGEISADVREKLEYGPQDEIADILATGRIDDILYAAETFLRQIPGDLRNELDGVELSECTRKYFNELDSLGAEPFVKRLDRWAAQFAGKYVVEPYDFDGAIGIRVDTLDQAETLAGLLAPATIFEDRDGSWYEVASY